MTVQPHSASLASLEQTSELRSVFSVRTIEAVNQMHVNSSFLRAAFALIHCNRQLHWGGAQRSASLAGT
ncbi:hypothetical protein [Burkholderia gladioli]|uniref:hypothetical protein n=1 Tax=Burkholderia gladioli TaxID=28095 RepID=UPI0011D26078|nr:hypothetical protein [Burkholderia gladioli]MBW5288048.1 hypothetical protein [Burkholderia gladioli]